MNQDLEERGWRRVYVRHLTRQPPEQSAACIVRSESCHGHRSRASRGAFDYECADLMKVTNRNRFELGPVRSVAQYCLSVTDERFNRGSQTRVPPNFALVVRAMRSVLNAQHHVRPARGIRREEWTITM